ncbi:MAG: hypothetical protein FJZ98_00200 [Chloroflexi bacterium]|nr:hypothetical protein [Chloroflexota bacterium]
MKSTIPGDEKIPFARKLRQWRRRILIAIPAVYALVGWLRLDGALTYREYFATLNLWPRPIYFAITGGLIGVTFSLAAFLWLLHWRYAAVYTRWLAIVFLIWFWVDRIWLSVREAFFHQLETGILITLITIVWVFILIRRKDLQLKPKGLEENGEQTGTGSQILPE